MSGVELEPVLLGIIGRLAFSQTIFIVAGEISLSTREMAGMSKILGDCISGLEYILQNLEIMQNAGTYYLYSPAMQGRSRSISSPFTWMGPTRSYG